MNSEAQIQQHLFRNDEAIQIMARFPMVTIEKGQGVSLGTGPGNYAEEKILATLKRVKAVDKNISTIFYYNSVLDWPFYSLHAQLEKRLDLAVHDENGELCRMGGDGSFPNHTNMLVFDFAQVLTNDFDVVFYFESVLHFIKFPHHRNNHVAGAFHTTYVLPFRRPFIIRLPGAISGRASATT